MMILNIYFFHADRHSYATICCACEERKMRAKETRKGERKIFHDVIM